MKLINLIFPTLCIVFSGCISNESLVRPGESRKLNTPSGIYSDVYVDEVEIDSPIITLSSPSEDSIQVVNYFDQLEVERIAIARGTDGMILSFSGDATNPENMSITSVRGTGESRKKTNYKLIAIDE